MSRINIFKLYRHLNEKSCFLLLAFPGTKRRRIRQRLTLVSGCFMGPGGVLIVTKRAKERSWPFSPSSNAYPRSCFPPFARVRWPLNDTQIKGGEFFSPLLCVLHFHFRCSIAGNLSSLCAILLPSPSTFRSLHFTIRFCVDLPLLKGLPFFLTIISALSLHIYSPFFGTFSFLHFSALFSFSFSFGNVFVDLIFFPSF